MKINLRNKYILLVTVLLFYHQFSRAQNIDFGKSYVNLTKGLNGGTIEPGDILEIRASFVVRSGVYDSCSYSDNIPFGTAYIPGTVRVLTNEGKIYKQFTDVINDDEGWINGTNVRINLGFVQTDAPARSFRRGRVRNSYVAGAGSPLHKPSFYTSTCIQVASFQIRVTAAIGSIINTGGGFMTYKSGANPLQTFNFPNNLLAVYSNIGMCPNLVGANTLSTEFNGTFGSGKPRNRGTSPAVPPSYTYAVFTNGGPNDYYYGIANNTSTQANYTTLNTWPKPDGSSPTHRVFSVWDIIGDHTGAVSPTLGNPAADTVNNNNGGYMLVVNASYRIDSAFQHVISGLCPNTYYEISCWMRNICSKCGCDSNGRGATGGPGYIPTAPGPPGLADSSGVYPNITFEVDGIDYYTTGNIRYTGQWVKKGFTFRTSPTQTSFNLKFFNNASGGGGNDWALDDIAVATCFPNLSFSPSVFTGCSNNVVNFSATVRSFFSNYAQYKWQRSTNGGVTWTDEGISGAGSPVLVGGQYQYTVNHPPFIGTLAMSGYKYRLVVATTVGNLSNLNCSLASVTDVVTLELIDCTVLPVDLMSWDGRVRNNYAELKWVTENESEPVSYEIERSSDAVSFATAGTVQGTYLNGPIGSNYTYTDPLLLTGNMFYRLKIVSQSSPVRYSHVILLSNGTIPFDARAMINPFHNEIKLNLYIPEKNKVRIKLLDTYGRILVNREAQFEKGLNSYPVSGLEMLSNGIYILNISYGKQQLNIKLIRN